MPPTSRVVHLLGGNGSLDHWYDNPPPEGIPTVFKLQPVGSD